MGKSMHWRDLLIGHMAFYHKEPRALYYDHFMKIKNWEKWADSVPLDEVKKLFDFIVRWDFHFQGDPQKFAEIYSKVSPIIQNLKSARLEDLDFNNDHVSDGIKRVFDSICDCSWKYESTDTSKILHTIVPDLFVMWDRNIRERILGDVECKWGAVYANDFLPKMQKEINDCISSFMSEKQLDRAESAGRIRGLCDNKSFPKLIDEYNYMVCTKPKEFLAFIQDLKTKGKITATEYERIAEKLQKIRNR
jgi:hypothetical protein